MVDLLSAGAFAMIDTLVLGGMWVPTLDETVEKIICQEHVSINTCILNDEN